MEFFNSISITEILISWELQSGNVVMAQNASNLLVILYAITSRKINDGCFFAAFFIDEIFSYSSYADLLNEPQYYLLISVIYCVLYWYIENKHMKLKTLVACGIIVLFNVWMSIDAIINKEVSSFIFTHYLPVVVFIHLYLISTLLEWKYTRIGMGQNIRGFVGLLGNNYNFAFIWYTIKNKVQSSKAKT